MAHSTPRRRGRGLRLLALGCAVLLSCTTVRTQVSFIPADVLVEDGRTEPQIDLWVESDRSLTEAEERRYRADARRALEQALAGRSQPEGDAVLVVRAQGVSRTQGRRSDQAGAVVGMVLGAVVIVAVVVLAVISGDDGGSGGSGKGAKGRVTTPPPRAGGPAVAPRPGVAPPRFSAAPPRPVPHGFRPGPRLPRPGGPPPFAVHRPPRPGPIAPPPPGPYLGGHDHDGIAVGVDVWWWQVYPEPLQPPPLLQVDAPPVAVADEVMAAEPGARGLTEEGEAARPSPHPTRIPLQAPEPMPVAERGFFAGDRLRLEALVLDRRTGEVLWTKRVERGADPRDAGAVRQAVDDLLQESGWVAPVPAGS